MRTAIDTLLRAKREPARAWLRRGVGLAVVAAMLASCSRTREEPVSPRLVILYSVCTVNKEYLGPYADGGSFTPNLDRFAKDAAVLLAHRTESGLSGTAFASIFSGVQADRHGVFKHPKKLPEELYLVFEAFADAGFETFYWSAHPMSRPRLGYGQGVEPSNIVRAPLTGTEPRFRAVLDRLRRDETYRAFIVTSFTVTHDPWNLEDMPQFRERYPEAVKDLPPDVVRRYHTLFKWSVFQMQTRYQETIDKLAFSEQDVDTLSRVLDLVYRSKIHLLDGMFGSVVEAVEETGLDDASLIAFTADHGEQLDAGESYRWAHGPDLAPAVIDVPLLIRGTRGQIRPQRIGRVTRSIDIFPTLAGLSGITVPAEAEIAGHDLSAALRGREEFPTLDAFSHGTLRQWKFVEPDRIDRLAIALRRDDQMYRWRIEGDMWHLDAERITEDGGRTPLDPTAPEHRHAAGELWQYRAKMVEAANRWLPLEPTSKEEELGSLSEEDAEALRSLGYIE